MAPAPTAKTSLGDALEVVFRNKWKCLLIPATVVALGAAIVLFFPRTYQSEAKLFLQIGRESVAIAPTAQTGQQLISMQQMGRDTDVTSAIDLLISRGVAAKVVERMGADYILRGGPAGSGEGQSNPLIDAAMGPLLAAVKAIKSIDPIDDTEEAIIQVEKSLLVDAERDSALVNVSYSCDTAEGAREILTAVIETFQQEHLRVHRNTGSLAFFQQQEADLREQLDRAMERVRAAKTEIGVASIDARRTNLEGRIQAIQMDSYTAQTERSSALASLADLRRQLGGVSERLVSSRKEIPNEGADLMREKLYELQVRQADLKARYSEQHPLVLAASRQVDEAEDVVSKQSTLRTETTDDVNPVHRELSLAAKQKEAVIAGLDGRIAMLAEQDRAVRGDLEKLNADEVRLRHLERDLSLLEKKYFQYAENLEQSRIDQELQESAISSISVAQAPTLAKKPVSPSKLIVLLASIVLSFAGTAAAVLGLEQLNDKLRGEPAIERAMGVPVLASIPESAVHGRVLAP